MKISSALHALLLGFLFSGIVTLFRFAHVLNQENIVLKSENAILKFENKKLKKNKVAKVFNDWINETDNPIDWNKMVDQIHAEHDLESEPQKKN